MTGRPIGAQHHKARLSEGAVRRIRELHRQGMGYGEIAQMYGVTRMAVRDVVLRRSWKNVE